MEKYIKFNFRSFLSLAFCLLGIVTVEAQKRSLDEEAYAQWRYIVKPQLSDDGQWVSFEHRNKDSLQVMYLWSRERVDTLRDCKGACFSGTSRYVIYTRELKALDKEKGKKKVYELRNLATGEIKAFARATSLAFLNKGSDWVKVVRQHTSLDSLKKEKGKVSFDVILYHPQTEDSICFSQQTAERTCLDGNGLLLRSADGWKLYNTTTCREWALPLGAEAEMTMVSFSEAGNKMACIYKEKKDEKALKLLLFDRRGKCLPDTLSSSELLPKGFEVVSGRLAFSSDGNSLFFRIAKKAEDIKSKKKVTAVPQIWAWDKTDNFLSMEPLKERESYFCALYLGKKKRLTILNSAEMPYLQFPSGESESLTVGFGDCKYRHLAGIEAGPLFDSYLVDMNKGTQTKVLERKYYNPSISTDKRYIVWFEPEEKAWISMDTHTLEKRNLTAAIQDCFYDAEMDKPMHAVHYGSMGWSKTGHSIFINSQYDWWLIDASGEKAPICLTQGVGREKRIVLRPVNSSESQRYFNPDSTYYFTAFQPSSKKSGYYRLRGGTLQELVFSDHFYSQLKVSKDGSTCLWRRENFCEYPELYISTADFKEVRRVSFSDEIQKRYLWGTAELVKWRTFQQDTLQGILCKPEGFDPQKKYPMLVYFYERKSDNLNKYNIPAPIGTVINWSYCVSNGYLVFVPDVTFRAGSPGQSSYNAIVSGVKSLIDRYDFVDANRIGLNGHSWGGYQSAYLITQTNMFKAAVAGAPVANMTSAYGAVRWSSGKSRMFQYEHGQSRMGGTLWEKPMEYIKNSALFFAPQLHTPLLIMHNDQDGAVPWEQGTELFMALRRLGKPVWMFNYKGQGHKLLKWDYRMDYSRRVMEFYDYFLKDGEKPEWM